jgi:hypothetical protein
MTTMPAPTEKEKKVVTKLCAAAIIKRIETITGNRYCKECNKMLPLENFDLQLKNAPRFLCKTHTKELYHSWGYGTHDKRAFSTFKAKLQADRKIFDQDRIEIKKRDIVNLVKPEHLQNFGEWAIIPKNPGVPISGQNMEIVSIYMRRCLVRRWKKHKDPAQYTALLDQMLQHGAQGCPDIKN